MALSFLYRLIRHVVEYVRVHRMDAVAKDAEILVLRRQVGLPASGGRIGRSSPLWPGWSPGSGGRRSS